MSAKDTPDIACFVGTPIWNDLLQQWVCPDSAGGTYTNPDGSIIRNNNTHTEVIYVQPQATASTTITGSITSLVDWVKGHPIILLGGVALLVWFFFMRGGKMHSRTHGDSM